MPGLNSNQVFVILLQINLEKLLHNVVSVLKVWVLQLQLQLNENIVVFVIGQAEAVSLKHLTIWHSPVTNVDLWTFRVHIFPSLNLEFVLVRHPLQWLLPNSLRLILISRCFNHHLWLIDCWALLLLERFALGFCASHLHLSEHV